MKTFLVSALLAGSLATASSSSLDVIPSPFIEVSIDLPPSAQCEQVMARLKSLIEEVVRHNARDIVVPLCIATAGNDLQRGRIALKLSYFEDVSTLSRRLKLLYLPMSIHVSADWKLS